MNDTLPFLFAALFLIGIGQTENAQFGIGPIRARRQNVWQKHGESTVIVQPPNVNSSALLFHTETADAVLHFSRQIITLWIPLNINKDITNIV